MYVPRGSVTLAGGVDCDVQYVIVFGDCEMRLLNELPNELASADIDDCQTWGDIFTLLIVGESQLQVATMCLEFLETFTFC